MNSTNTKEYRGYKYTLERMTEANFFASIDYPGEITVTYGALNWFQSSATAYAKVENKIRKAIDDHINALKRP